MSQCTLMCITGVQKARHVMFIIRKFWTREVAESEVSYKSLTSAIVVFKTESSEENEASERGLFSWKRKNKVVKNKFENTETY